MSNALATIESDIYGVRERFNAISVDNSIVFEREAGFALQVIGANDYLQKVAIANRQSVVDAITNISAIGISLNPAKKQAYLVPRKGKICLDLSYMGLMDLVVGSGSIRWAKAEPVYATDGFALNGYDKPPTHTHNPFAKDRGEFVGVYVVVKTSSGDYLTDTMAADDVIAIRDRSEAWKAWIANKKSCPWVTDFVEMAKKTVVKRASKYWPKDDHRIQEAIQLLNTDGEEGFSVQTDAPPVSGFNSIDWCTKAHECKTLEALLEVWNQAGAEATAVKDRGGYAMVRNAVAIRRAEIEKEMTVDMEQA